MLHELIMIWKKKRWALTFQKYNVSVVPHIVTLTFRLYMMTSWHRIASASLAICEGNLSVTDKFPQKSNAELFFGINWANLLDKQSSCRWMETLMWRQWGKTVWFPCKFCYCTMIDFRTHWSNTTLFDLNHRKTAHTKTFKHLFTAGVGIRCQKTFWKKFFSERKHFYSIQKLTPWDRMAIWNHWFI